MVEELLQYCPVLQLFCHFHRSSATPVSRRPRWRQFSWPGLSVNSLFPGSVCWTVCPTLAPSAFFPSSSTLSSPSSPTPVRKYQRCATSFWKIFSAISLIGRIKLTLAAWLASWLREFRIWLQSLINCILILREYKNLLWTLSWYYVMSTKISKVLCCRHSQASHVPLQETAITWIRFALTLPIVSRQNLSGRVQISWIYI